MSLISRLTGFALFFFLFLFVRLSASPLDVSVDAKVAILMDADSGKVLFEKEAHLPAYPASLTKIATALFVLEKHKEQLQEIFPVSREALKSINSEEKRRKEYATPTYWLEEGSSNIALAPGEREPLFSLLAGMLVASGNDAANVVAEGVGKTIPHFMDEMGSYLKEIGCEKTHFVNPHGVHHPSHVTTAFELAEMTRRAMKIEEFQKMVATLSYTHGSHSYSQTNRLMKKGKYFYPYALGVKTGYTSHADYNLVAAAEKEGRRLIAVIMGCSENFKRYEDARHLFETAFSEKKVQKVLLKAPKIFQMRIEGAKTVLETQLAQDVMIECFPSEEEPLEIFLHWKKCPLPIAKGSEVAAIEVFNAKKQLLIRSPLTAEANVSATFFHRWKEFFSSLFGLHTQKAEKIVKS